MEQLNYMTDGESYSSGFHPGLRGVQQAQAEQFISTDEPRHTLCWLLPMGSMAVSQAEWEPNEASIVLHPFALSRWFSPGRLQSSLNVSLSV